VTTWLSSLLIWALSLNGVILDLDYPPCATLYAQALAELQAGHIAPMEDVVHVCRRIDM
jgi:hypothetical protein